MTLFKIRRIPGCVSGTTYMTRIILIELFGRRLMVNIFHQSDEDRFLHDHPWQFWSLILWNGYIEHTRNHFRVVRPLRLIHRPARWAHRVELVKKPAITLVFTGKKIRDWGFHTPSGWLHWKQYGKDFCGQEWQD